MATIQHSYTPANIFQSPTDVYIGIAAPASSYAPTADTNCLALDADGQPTSATGVHVGHIEGPTNIQVTEKVNEIMDDQHDIAVDVAFVSVAAQVDFTMKEFNLDRINILITGGALTAYNAITGAQVLQLGGQTSTSIGPTTILMVSPRRDDATKFIYAMFYRTYLAAGLSTQFQRTKESVWKVTVKALMDTTRVTGDELGVIVRQK